MPRDRNTQGLSGPWTLILSRYCVLVNLVKAWCGLSEWKHSLMASRLELWGRFCVPQMWVSSLSLSEMGGESLEISFIFILIQSNLLASGASDSEIFIWDLNHLSVPMTPGSKSQVRRQPVFSGKILNSGACRVPEMSGFTTGGQ